MKSIDLSEGNSPMTMMEMGERHPEVTLREDGAYELPDEGEITFAFVKKRYVEENMGDKKQYSCTLELHKLLDVVDKSIHEPASNKSKDAGDALDAIRAEKMKDSDEGEY